MKGPDAPRSARRCRAISASMLSIRPNVGANRNWGWSARCPLNGRPNSFYCALPVLYLDRRGRLKARIHGRPRSDRKRSFLLSAVAPSTSTRHPREARPINWAQRGGLASGGKCSPDAEATFHRASCTPGNQVVVLRTALLFVRSAVRLVYAELPGAGSGLLAQGSNSASWVIVSWVATASLSPVESNRDSYRDKGSGRGRPPAADMIALPLVGRKPAHRHALLERH